MNENKIPDYIIHENVAWDNIEFNSDIEKSLKEKYDLFYFNILSCRSEKSYNTLKNIFKNIDSKYIVEDMKMITSFTDQNIKELLDKIEDHIKKSDNIYNKMMLENIREVYKEIYKINKYVS